MSDSPVSLASLMTPSKTVSIDFPGYSGMKVDLCYLAREELLKLRKKCLSTKFDREVLVQLLGVDKDDIDDILRNCNFSDTFIQQANDLQIMEAINECYDEYKLLEF